MQKEPHRELLDFFVAKCRQHHLRITPQRRAIYKLIAKSKEHPCADEVFQALGKEFPNISYDTVNRTLMTFSRIGLVNLVAGHGGPRRFDPDMERHHHFQCRRCGRIIDFCNEDYDRLEIPEEIRNRCTVLDKRVVLNGICDLCGRK